MFKHPTRQPLNLTHRLRDRQLHSCPSGTAVGAPLVCILLQPRIKRLHAGLKRVAVVQVSYSRRLYDCLAPQTVVSDFYYEHIRCSTRRAP